MAGTIGNGGDRGFAPIAGINVTPLVDICLVLLIIFMVTTSYIVIPTIRVELPRAATGEATGISTLAIVLTLDGGLYLNGTQASEADLSAAIRKEQRAKNDVQVIIGADKAVPHGRVVRTIDLAKQEGVHKFAISVEEP